MDGGGAMRFDDYKLPPGRHRMSIDGVRANQRWRLLGACAEVLRHEGYVAITVSRVVETARISKGDFYRYFDNLPQCILATHEMAVAAALEATRNGCRSATASASLLSSAVTSLLEFLASEPALAAVLIDAALDDLPGVIEARISFSERLAAVLAEARGEVIARDLPRPRLSNHLVGAARRWLAARLRAGETAAVPGTAAELTYFLMLSSPNQFRREVHG
jgi:AcrR family transcriptional regulator